jgi:hypothetical protein
MVYSEHSLLSKPPLLRTESEEEFDALHKALEQEIEPRGIIEQMYVADICHIIWESLRLHRNKAIIINIAYRAALEHILTRLLHKPGQFADAEQKQAQALAEKWFQEQNAKDKVLQLLNRVDLDETAIEAQAIITVSSELELLNRMLASLEARRNKALRCIAEYRDSLATQLRERSDRTIGKQDVLRLEHDSTKKAGAA